MSDGVTDIHYASKVEKEEDDIELHEMVTDTAAQEPLIGADQRRVRDGYDTRNPPNRDGPGHESAGHEDDEDDDRVKPTRFVCLLVLAAGISGLLFGYEYVL